MRFNIDINLKVSKFIQRFIIADTVLFGGWGFVDPIFSIFILQEIAGASLVTVGITVAIYWVLKSAIQIPVALFLDRTDGERDDFYTLITALVVVGIASFLMTLAVHVWQLYLIQVLKAVGFGMYVASFPALFSRHLDKGHYSLDWSLDSTSVGFAIGIAGFLGSIAVTFWGYASVFIIAGSASLIAAGVLLTIPQLVLPAKVHSGSQVLRDHTPVNINQ